MRTGRKALVLLLAIALGVLLTAVVAGCGGDEETTTTTESTTTTASATTTTAGTATTGVIPSFGEFSIELTGAEEVPPVTTQASGKAVFTFNASTGGLDYRIEVTNITDATAAHIHTGARGKSGPILVTLFPGPTKTGTFSGNLVEGSFTAAQLSGDLQGKTLADLMMLALSGQLYVNVHTEAHPDGEIRGQMIIQTLSGSTTTSAAGGGTTTTG